MYGVHTLLDMGIMMKLNSLQRVIASPYYTSYLGRFRVHCLHASIVQRGMGDLDWSALAKVSAGRARQIYGVEA